MRSRWLRLLAAAATCHGAVHATELQCAIDPASDAHQCIAPAELKETDGVRWAPLYRGGPNALRKSSLTAHANCRSRVLHLKDPDGVSIATGRFSDTAMSRQMGALLCDTPLPSPKKKK